MRLSQAILMGRYTIDRPQASYITDCAIPMALNAAGRGLMGCSESGELDKIELLPGNDYNQLLIEWPWLRIVKVGCPQCASVLHGSALVFHVFDWHVSRGQITLEQMCDWIRSIEPAEEEYIPDEEPWTDSKTTAEMMNSIKGR